MTAALIFGNPLLELSKQWSKRFLQIAIVGLGAGVDLHVVARAGVSGIGYTVAGIVFAMTLGWLLGRVFRTERETSLLLSVGTAICGGSAIAAVAGAIKPKSESVSLALAAVFTLNAVALWIFPWVGHQLHFSQTQFGMWSALAIHDTSSVVGAAMQYGADALQIATTIKLTRALWIVPLTLVIALRWRSATHDDGAGIDARSPQLVHPSSLLAPTSSSITRPIIHVPWFIIGFLLMSAITTWLPSLHTTGDMLANFAKRLLVLAIFCIGATITRKSLQTVGLRLMAHALTLWFFVACVSALVARNFF